MPKGRKTCKSCGKEVGLRTSKCDCGYEFVKKEQQETVPEVAINRYDLTVVHTPGTGMGDKSKLPLIPVKPESLDKISEWIEDCQKWGEKRGLTFAVNAFYYMARQIWRTKDELRQALAAISKDFADRAIPEEVASNEGIS